MHQDLQTVRDFIHWAMSQFNQTKLYYGHGTDNAQDEAITLIVDTLHLPHDISPALLDSRLSSDEKELLYKMIQRRVSEHVPVPYLTHTAWFAGEPFYVDERVLIPRSPIAELIENHFQPWIEIESIKNILDLCTGSGCIAIACAKVFPDAAIDASDISRDALDVAKINVRNHHVEDQLKLYQSDLFSELPQKKYDVIISNPPYVDAEDMETLPDEYHHEPSLGLAAGKNGLDFALPILRDAKKFLSPHGILIVEVGNSEHALAELFPEIPFTWLEFHRGGGGVFLLTAEQLQKIEYSQH